MAQSTTPVVRIRIADATRKPLSESKRREEALARENNPLPWRRDVLNDGALASLSALLQRVAQAPGQFSKEVLAGAYWLQLILTTGRSLRDLHAMPIFDREPAKQTAYAAHGLYRGSSVSAWWLPPGKPTSKQNRLQRHRHLYRRRCNSMIIWSGPKSRQLLDVVTQRAAIAFGRSGDTRRVGTDIKTAARAVAACLKQIQPDKKLYVTLGRIDKWLYHKLLANSGDPALAGILTNRIDTISNATAHYTWMSRKQAFERHFAAVLALEGLPTGTSGYTLTGPYPHVSTYQAKDDEGYGGRLVPTHDVVRNLALTLQQELEELRPAAAQLALDALARFHTAFTLYTLAMVGFAGGMRGIRSPIPQTRSINYKTGFVVVRDKGREHADRTRLIWLPDDAVMQISHFQGHMAIMLGMYPDIYIQSVMPKGFAQPCRFDANGKWHLATVKWLRAELANRGFPIQLNAWRHYLRTELLGAVSADVLHAFLGHAQRGQEPWARHAALDPLVYRAELKRAIKPMLAAAGWNDIVGIG